jgi:hypothetical protein
MKTAAQAATKWKAGTAGAQPLYVANAAAAANTQVANAIAGAQNWLSGINAAGIASYTAGLSASQAKGTYAKKINSVGGARYGQGTGAAADLFTAQIGKVLQVEAGVALGPRGPKGSPANTARSSEMQAALHAAKVAGQFQ